MTNYITTTTPRAAAEGNGIHCPRGTTTLRANKNNPDPDHGRLRRPHGDEMAHA